MSADDEVFKKRLVTALAQAAANFARPSINSQTLRSHLTPVIYNSEQGAAFIPDYWAIYLHDGRGPISARSSGTLIYFRDPKNDPRLVNGVTPQRLASTRSMSKAQFNFWLQKNRAARAQGLPSPMVVIDKVGPMRGTFFFDNNRGMSGFHDVAQETARPLVQRFIRDRLRKHIKVTKDSTKGVI